MKLAQRTLAALARPPALCLALALALNASPALAATAPPPGIQQSGAATSGHCSQFTGNLVIADAGQACGGVSTALGGTGAASTLTTGNSVTQLVTSPVTSGLIAEYPLNDGAGSTVRDISGNGNTAMLGSGAAAPTWTPYGLFFNQSTASTFAAIANQYVQTTIKTFGTVEVHACIPSFMSSAGAPLSSGVAPPQGIFWSQSANLIGSPSTSNGLLFLNTTSVSNTRNGTFLPGIYTTGGSGFFTTSKGFLSARCGVVAFTLGDPDLIYFNGNLVSLATQGNAAPYVTTTGTGYLIGSGAYGAPYSPWVGSINYVKFFSGVLTQAELQQDANYINFQVQNRPGWPTYGGVSNSSTDQLIFSGTSLVAGFEGSVPWTSSTYVVTNHTYNMVNLGVEGEVAPFEIATVPARLGSVIASGARNVCYEDPNGNLNVLGGYTAAQGWSIIQALGRADRQAGCNVVLLGTMISQNGQDTFAESLNELEVAGWSQTFDGLVDLWAIPEFAASGNTNSACYNADKIHLTGPGPGSCYNSLSGYSAYAADVAAIVNVIDGSTKSNPTISASNAYTENIVDSWLQITPTANGTIVLPDCTGMTGTQRHITNGAPSTYTETVSGGGASSTVVGNAVVPSGGTLNLTCLRVPGNSGGDYWQVQ